MSFFTSKGTKLIRNAEEGNLDQVLDLLGRGANVNAKNEQGSTALIYASARGHVNVVRALLNHGGVDVNVKNNNGDTALILASDWGRVEVARALLKHNGVDVNIKNTNGNTALIFASWNGHLEVVRALLNHDGVDVNIKNNDGYTALEKAMKEKKDDAVHLFREHMARKKEEQKRFEEGESKSRDEEVWKRLEEEKRKRCDEDVRKRFDEERMKRCEEELRKRCQEEVRKHLEEEGQKRREEEVRKCREEEVRKRREEEEWKRREEEVRKRREEEEWNRRKPSVTGDPPCRNDNSPSSDDAKIEHDRSKLLTVMNTTAADPVELSLEYIQRCIKKDHKLGSGAYGDVFLAEDGRLPKKFAVKMISPTHCDEAAIKMIRKTFQKEILTLTRFRHPNIIALYGYSLNANSTQQCLAYEYAANGSLAGFFSDDGNRARLSAGIRLSIMFKLARAVHFLHTGGCKVGGKGWKVFHRDIKSANICLADDFAPRLIDCGLAKFVPDDNSRANPGSFTVSLQSKSRGLAFGTPGYMCPVYVKTKGKGLSCPYVAAFDVYSIGVVLVELILGCLNGGQSTRNDFRFHDVFAMYVQDERTYQRIVDGSEKLKGDADPTIIWNSDALELACKAAIQCMAPFPEERLSTKELLDTLRDAISLNTNADIHHPLTVSTVDSGPYCSICNDNRTDIKCSEGHALCATCIVDKLGDDNGCQLLCLIKECSSKLQDKELYGRIPLETYKRYVEKRADQAKLDECLLRLDLMRFDFYVVKVGVQHTKAMLQKQQQMIQRFAKGLNRSLAALALLSSNQFNKCPNLVWLSPISVGKKDRSTPKNWIRHAPKQRYSVVFICAHSGVPGHEPFEIAVPQKWIAKIAPWLKLCLKVVNMITTSPCLPFPIPNLPFIEQSEMMNTFLDSAIEEASIAVVEQCVDLVENGTMPMETSGEMQALAGDAFKFIAEKSEGNTNWKKSMVPVCRQNGTPVWVKGIYKVHYEL